MRIQDVKNIANAFLGASTFVIDSIERTEAAQAAQGQTPSTATTPSIDEILTEIRAIAQKVAIIESIVLPNAPVQPANQPPKQ